jgi:hypothetical protein
VRHVLLLTRNAFTCRCEICGVWHGWLLPVTLVATLSEKQTETADLVLFDTDEFIGHFPRLLGWVHRWEKPGPEKTNGAN